jgi:hypothetical protein
VTQPKNQLTDNAAPGHQPIVSRFYISGVLFFCKAIHQYYRAYAGRELSFKPGCFHQSAWMISALSFKHFSHP